MTLKLELKPPASLDISSLVCKIVCINPISIPILQHATLGLSSVCKVFDFVLVSMVVVIAYFI